VSLCVFDGLFGVLEGLVGLWLWFGVVGECLTGDSQCFKCLGGVETVLSLGVELVVLILDSYLSYVGLYLAY